MTRVYRILRRAFARNPFDGEGAYRYGGRWSSPGTRLAYAAEHVSLAIIEYFVHIDSGDAPRDLVLVAADIPDSLSRISMTTRQLPRNWRQSPAPTELARIGDEFIAEGKGAVLVVPSALSPTESNFLLNPMHPAFAKIKIHIAESFWSDPRFFRT